MSVRVSGAGEYVTLLFLKTDRDTYRREHGSNKSSKQVIKCHFFFVKSQRHIPINRIIPELFLARETCPSPKSIPHGINGAESSLMSFQLVDDI